jgi:hypothetical protein
VPFVTDKGRINFAAIARHRVSFNLLFPYYCTKIAHKLARVGCERELFFCASPMLLLGAAACGERGWGAAAGVGAAAGGGAAAGVVARAVLSLCDECGMRRMT